MAKVKCSACFNLVDNLGGYCCRCGAALAGIEKQKSRQSFGTRKPREFWCPLCNHKVELCHGYCDCGWKINSDNAMNAECPVWLWEKHKPFIDECRFVKDKGMAKSGYEYFKLKVGNTKLGKLMVSKVEYKYTKVEEEQRRLAIFGDRTFPKEWNNPQAGSGS